MSRYLQIIRNIKKSVNHNGGLVGTYLSLFRTDEVKWGKLIGEDKFGNKYYENNHYFLGRNRWVVYSDSVGLDYDGSQIPPEWQRWMNSMTDNPPTTHPLHKPKWVVDHMENFSGTSKEYVPYSTTPPKIQAWDPPPARK